ncbi:MAG: hypothetical protein LBE13_23305 [Bacteroidales bacterium]|nr:hypothetical protein [Bacteroidales bacterium]
MSKLCKYYGLNRNNCYKSIQKDIQEEMSKMIIVEIIQLERRRQPHTGKLKLYHIYKEIIHKTDPNCGRDSLFRLMI